MRRRLPIILITAVLITALLAATPSQATASAALEWTPVTPAVPRPDTTGSVALIDVAATSPADVWTLGSFWGDTGAFTAHWDGIGWSLAPALDTAGFDVSLRAIDAVAASDVWVAGHRRPLDGHLPVRFAAAVAHFDGAAWTVVPTPPPAEGTSYLLKDIDMVSAAEGWAVGESFRYLPGGKPTWKPLVLRWQNGQWTEATLPTTSGDNVVLEAVHARSAADVWAVGRQGDTALIMHWDGTQWSQISSPQTEAGSELRAVTAISATDAWAVGATCAWVDDPGFASCQPLAMHLSGGSWHVVPAAGDSGTFLVEVVARSANDVWAVGYDKPATRSFEVNHVEHWDGHRFTTVPAAPAPAAGPIGTLGSLASALSGVTVNPGSGDLWAVGWTVDELGTGGPQVIRHG